MTHGESLTSWISVGSVIVNAAILIVIGFQLRTMSEGIRKDHERRIKQATLEIMAPRVREGREFLAKLSPGREPLTEEELTNILKSHKAKAEVDKALGMLEHNATGLNIGVYDKELYFQIFGSSFLLIFNKMKPYVDYRRDSAENELNAYIEIEQIALEYKKRAPFTHHSTEIVQ